MYCVWQVVKTPTIISNHPIFTGIKAFGKIQIYSITECWRKWNTCIRRTQISTTKPSWNSPLVRSIFTWQYNIKMDCKVSFEGVDRIHLPHCISSHREKKIAASSMLHEAKITYYAFDAAILFAITIGPAVAKATWRHCLSHFIDCVAARTCCAVNVLTSRISFLFSWPWWMGSVVKHNMLKSNDLSPTGRELLM